MGPRTKRAASRATPSPASLSDEDRARVARALAHARGAEARAAGRAALRSARPRAAGGSDGPRSMLRVMRS